MRTTLFTTICAILLGAVTLSAQQTTDKYVINGKEIQEVFDGSQLEGLKVESYKIETSTEGGTTVRTHVITTSEVDPSAKEYNDPIYVVDEKVVSKEDFDKVNALDIFAIEVIKNSENLKNGRSEMIKQIDPEGRGVIVVTLKKKKSDTYKPLKEIVYNESEMPKEVVVKGKKM